MGEGWVSQTRVLETLNKFLNVSTFKLLGNFRVLNLPIYQPDIHT